MDAGGSGIFASFYRIFIRVERTEVEEFAERRPTVKIAKSIIGWTLFTYYYFFLVICLLDYQETQLNRLQYSDSTTCVPRQIVIDHMDKSRMRE